MAMTSCRSPQPALATPAWLLPALGALLFLLLTGCLRHETAVQVGNREQSLHRGIGSDVGDLDPQLVLPRVEKSREIEPIGWAPDGAGAAPVDIDYRRFPHRCQDHGLVAAPAPSG